MILLDCSCLSTCINLDCNSISTWIQFGLSLLGVVLSAIAILETCIVKRTVIRQKYDTEQELIMSKLVKALNKNLIRTDFICQHDKVLGHTVPASIVNFFFIANDKGKTYYDNAPIYVTTNTNSNWIYDFLYNPYTPTEVAKALSSFILLKQNSNGGVKFNSLLDEQGIVLLQMGTDGFSDNVDLLYDPKFNNITNWKEFKKSTRKLKKSIAKWYTKKGIKSKLNIISEINIITVDNSGVVSKRQDINI